MYTSDSLVSTVAQCIVDILCVQPAFRASFVHDVHMLCTCIASAVAYTYYAV
jgi:hypothetical protein